MVTVTVEQAQRVIDAKVGAGGHSLAISEFKELYNGPHCPSPTTKSYQITLADALFSPVYILTTFAVSSPTAVIPPNSLATVLYVHKLVRACTSIPLAHIHTVDETLTILICPYILLSCPTPPIGVSLARLRAEPDRLSPQQATLIDLQLGVYMREIHNVQNDWYGLPLPQGCEPPEPSYSWQETFTAHLEALLHALEDRQPEISLPYDTLRRCLSRAIGFFIFDDVEVPSLISFMTSENDIMVHIAEDGTPKITFFQLDLTNALWGDPLLESLFMPPGPRSAVLEGYGRPIFVFPRQTTKRLWYTLFTALLILIQGGHGTTVWARETVEKCALELTDAPFFHA